MRYKDFFKEIFDLKTDAPEWYNRTSDSSKEDNFAKKESEFGYAIITVWVFVLLFLLVS